MYISLHVVFRKIVPRLGVHLTLFVPALQMHSDAKLHTNTTTCWDMYDVCDWGLWMLDMVILEHTPSLLAFFTSSFSFKCAHIINCLAITECLHSYFTGQLIIVWSSFAVKKMTVIAI